MEISSIGIPRPIRNPNLEVKAFGSPQKGLEEALSPPQKIIQICYFSIDKVSRQLYK
jgi:hypothetical protein